MRVTKWGECGLLCSIYLAQKYGGEPIGAPEIAENQGFDLQYTQQVLHRLKKGEVVESARGPKGGYKLSRSPEMINLYEILLAAEGDTFEIICDHSPIRPSAQLPNLCADKQSCGLHHVWVDLKDAINSLLQSRTLASVAAFAPTQIEGGLVEISHHRTPS